MSRDRTDAILEVRGLEVAYRTDRGRVHALRQVSFEVGEGRVVGLAGESGCGKSTLIAAVLRLLPANAEVTGGAVWFEGRDLATLGEAEMRALRGDRLAVVFQDPTSSLHPVLSIGDQMIDAQHRSTDGRALKRSRAASMLERVGIADAGSALDRYAHELSGGMRQRVAIAMALLSRPALLIADEPTAALDATTKAQILHLLRELQQESGCAVLFVSHHLGAIARLCDDMVVMYAGEAVESGTTEEVFHRPAHPYTRALLACDPARVEPGGGSLPTIPGTVPDLLALPEGCVFAPRCPEAIDRCRIESPARRSVGARHTATCHLLEEGAGGR